MVKKIKHSFFKKYYLELVIFLLALVLRYVGLVPGFPPWHPDEGTSYSTAIYMLGHSYKPDRFDYAAGMALIHAVVYKSIFLPIQLVRLFATQPEMFFSYLKLDEQAIYRSYDYLFGNRQVYAMFWSRYIAATFGFMAVMLLYFVVKRLFNRPTAIFSATFLAVNYRHVLGSHFGLPDVHGSFFGLLALLAAILLVEKKTAWRYVFVGITAGLYFSLKYQPFAFLPLLVAHLYWIVKEKKVTNLIHPYAWLALIAAISTFVLINPYYFTNIQNAFFRNDQDFRRYQMGVVEFRPYGYFYLFHWGIGELASVAVIVGVLAMLLTRFIPFLLISSFSFSILIFMTILSIGAMYTRNFVAPMPYFMIFAGYAVNTLYDGMKRLRFRYAGIVVGFIMLGLNIKPAYNSFLLSINYAKPWNTGVLEQWLATTLPENTRLRAYQLFLGPKGADTLKKKRITFLDWDYSKGPNSLAEFQERRDDFAILELTNLQNITYWWRGFPKKSFLWEYSDVPYDYILNSFFGLTVREFLPYTIHEIYKPWQAADETNYLIFKIPNLPEKKGKSIAKFSNVAINAWKPIDPFGLGSGNGTFRVSSPPFPVTPGKQYLISGFMKEEGDKEATYDGYLRLDFYKNQNDYKTETMSLGVAISARVLPNGEWTKKEFAATAPTDAHFATVSFQRFSPQFAYPTLLDDIEVFEAESVEPASFPQVPYMNPTIQWKEIFYHGFL